MDTRHPHDVMLLKAAEIADLRKRGRKFMELTDHEAQVTSTLTPDERGEWMRKNRNRNKTCPCGSGRKFKRCCW